MYHETGTYARGSGGTSHVFSLSTHLVTHHILSYLGRSGRHTFTDHTVVQGIVCEFHLRITLSVGRRTALTMGVCRALLTPVGGASATLNLPVSSEATLCQPVNLT